jgi:hypothetical protein
VPVLGPVAGVPADAARRQVVGAAVRA